MPQNFKEYMRPIVLNALHEDCSDEGDVTSTLLIDEKQMGSCAMVAREPMVVSGIGAAHYVFFFASQQEGVGEFHVHDGDYVEAGTTLLTVNANMRAILLAERTALNIAQRMSGIATATRAYVDAAADTKAVILDTRKTTPGLRALEKAAVMHGGGQNHRMGLFDAIFIKDNHIAAVGNIVSAVKRAKEGNKDDLPLIVECDTLAQVKEVLPLDVDRILLDNMAPDVMAEAVALSSGTVELEASGGITLDTVRDVAMSGVDYISIGTLTHSVRAMDIGLDTL